MRERKQVLDAAFLAEGKGYGAELSLTDDARHQPWVLDLENEARRLSVCESGACLVYDVARGAWKPKTLGCNCKLCPVCARVKAARTCGRWRGILEAAAADGAVFRHWTLTQRRDTAPGGLVTEEEVYRGWVGTLATETAVGRAVGGEGLGASYKRFRRSLTAVRDGRRTRARWREGLGACLVGIESTGRARGGHPSWHTHGHLLACTPPGVDVDVDGMLADWVAETGGSLRAQHVRIVDPGAVVEVLKYPFKPAHLTQAMRIETLAFLRGMHTHHASGAWNASSRAHREEPWAGWFAAREEPTEYLRLHVVPDSAVDQEGEERPLLWTGTPSEGYATWAVRRGGRWQTWRADAEDYARRLLENPGSGGIYVPPEPGSDLTEWL